MVPEHDSEPDEAERLQQLVPAGRVQQEQDDDKQLNPQVLPRERVPDLLPEIRDLGLSAVHPKPGGRSADHPAPAQLHGEKCPGPEQDLRVLREDLGGYVQPQVAVSTDRGFAVHRV